MPGRQATPAQRDPKWRLESWPAIAARPGSCSTTASGQSHRKTRDRSTRGRRQADESSGCGSFCQGAEALLPDTADGTAFRLFLEREGLTQTLNQHWQRDLAVQTTTVPDSPLLLAPTQLETEEPAFSG